MLKNKFYQYKNPIFIFLLIEILLYLFISLDRDSRIKEYLRDTSLAFDARYQMVIDSFDDKASIAYETLINKEAVKRRFKESVLTNEKHRDILRRELYKSLLADYEELREYGFKQVHFHLPNNHSFLRMHAPERFGDDLSGFRESVKYVNRTQSPISGFEEGVAYNGFRFVYPIFDDKAYIGSVELSFSAYVLADYMKSDFLDTSLIIDKDVIVVKSDGNLEEHYKQSTLHDGFVVDARYESSQFQFPSDDRFARYHENKADEKSSLSLDVKMDGKHYIESFIPIYNAVTKKRSAYLVMIADGKYLDKIWNYFWTIYVGLSLMALFLFIGYKRGKMYRQKIEKETKKFKTIIDSQHHMMVINDGKEMVEVNKKVLDFFGYKNFSQMHGQHTCICEFFIKHKEYYHLDLTPAGMYWVQHIQTLPKKEQVVSMLGKDMEAKAFYITFNTFDETGNFIMTFNDITDLLLEQKMLEYKAQHDTLTDIYNRQKIDEVLIKLCQYAEHRREQVGVIMFDIDHFKKVNDTYGHDVGDMALKEVVKIVNANIREEDIFGRWGGEEFILILRHANREDTFHKAEKIRKAIEAHRSLDIPNITASFGVTSVEKGDRLKTILKRVDIALYAAKDRGRNCVEMDQELLLV